MRKTQGKVRSETSPYKARLPTQEEGEQTSLAGLTIFSESSGTFASPEIIVWTWRNLPPSSEQKTAAQRIMQVSLTV